MNLYDNLSLNYVVRPSSIQEGAAPVMIMVHGYGSHEKDLFSFAPQIDESYVVVSVQAPFTLTPFGYAWYAIEYDPDNHKFINTEQALQSRDLIVKFIGEVVEKFKVDKNDVTLMGFSQGAILSYAVALSFPKRIRRVVAMSGYIDKDLLKSGYETSDFSHLEMFCSHGSEDEVVPVAWDRKTQPFLEDLGIKNTYREYPVGHGVSQENLGSVLNWLKK